MIAAYVGNNPKHWDKYLPVFCFALNSADHESSPQCFKLTFEFK